jgi:hypothetical protein
VLREGSKKGFPPTCQAPAEPGNICLSRIGGHLNCFGHQRGHGLIALCPSVTQEGGSSEAEGLWLPLVPGVLVGTEWSLEVWEIGLVTHILRGAKGKRGSRKSACWGEGGCTAPPKVGVVSQAPRVSRWLSEWVCLRASAHREVCDWVHTKSVSCRSP